MAQRLTYPDKTNNPSDPDLVNKFHYNEANAIKAVTDDHADKIEALELQAVSSNNPFYGRFTSLLALQTAFPTGVLNAWAIIDAGAGITPQIAAWDNDGTQWEIVGATAMLVFVATYADLPTTGEAQKLYITKGPYKLYVYNQGSYHSLTPDFLTQSTKNLFTATANQTDFELPITPVNVDVWVDRVSQIEDVDYTLEINTVIFATGLEAGSKVVVRTF